MDSNSVELHPNMLVMLVRRNQVNESAPPICKAMLSFRGWDLVGKFANATQMLDIHLRSCKITPPFYMAYFLVV